VVDVVECRFKIEIEAPQPRGALAGCGLEHRLDRVVAASARPEAIRPGFEACLPLGLQCVAHPVLLGAIGDGRYPQRPEFLVALRDVHPLDRQGLPRCGRPLEAVGQLRAVPGGQRDLPVYPCRRAASVLLGDAPHADQRIGTRAQHQPLKAGYLLTVASLLCREDPSPKTCHVPPGFAPVDGIPAERGVVGPVHHDRPGHRRAVHRAQRFLPFTRPASADHPQAHHAHVSALAGRATRTRIRLTVIPRATGRGRAGGTTAGGSSIGAVFPMSFDPPQS